MQESLVTRMAEHNADQDVSVIKIISLIAFACFAAMLSGYFILQFQWLYAVISLVCFWAIFALQAIFIKSWTKIFIAVGIESILMAIPVAIVLNTYFSSYLIASFAILFLSLLTAEIAARDTMKNAVHIPFWRVVREVLLKAVTGVLVFVSLVYIFVVGGSGVASVSGLGDTFITSVVRTVNSDLSSSSTTREVLKQFALRALSGDNLVAFNNLSEQQKASALNEAAISLFNSFSGYLGLTDIDATISKSFHDSLQNKFFSLSYVTQLYVFIIFAALLWFIIRSLAFVLYLPLAFVVYITYETLVALGFAVIQYESRSREIVILS